MTDYLPEDIALDHEQRVLLVDAINIAIQKSRDPSSPITHWLDGINSSYVEKVRNQCIQYRIATNQRRLSREELSDRVAAKIRRKALALTVEEEWEVEDGKDTARRIKVLGDIGRYADLARYSDNLSDSLYYLNRMQRGREVLAKLQEEADSSADVRIASFVDSLPDLSEIESVGPHLRRATPPPSVGGGVLNNDDCSNFESKACDDKPGHRKPTVKKRGENPDLLRAHMVDDCFENDTDDQDEEGFLNTASSASHRQWRSTYGGDPKLPKKSSALRNVSDRPELSKPVPRRRSTKDTAHNDYESPHQSTEVPHRGIRQRRFSMASGYPQSYRSSYEVPPSAHYLHHAPPQLPESSHTYTGHPPPSYGGLPTAYGYGSSSTRISARRPSISADAPYFSTRGSSLATAALPNRPPVQEVPGDLSEGVGRLSIYGSRHAYPER